MSYKKVYLPDHPNAMSCGCVYEHRLVMEQLLGRYLEPEEQVHHKDEDKTNNVSNNLVLCPTQKEHAQEHAYDDDTMIDLLIRYSDYNGRFPNRKECNESRDMPHSSTYARHFGSWSAAKRLAQYRLDYINEEMAG